MDIDYYREIIEALDIKEVMTFYGIEFNRSGFARCPFHAEKTASFKVQNEKYAHCFGCGINVDAISFVMKYFDIDCKAAMRQLNEDFRLGLPLDRKPTLKERSEAERRIKARADAIKKQNAEIEAWQKEYDRLYDEFAKCQIIIDRHSGALTDEYAKAVKRIDYISYLIDQLPPEPKKVI